MSHNRRNRKLFDALTKFDGELVDALFTTYNFDPSYFEGTLLPKLLDVKLDEQEDDRIVAVDLFHQLKQKEIVVVADGKVNKLIKKGMYGYKLLPVFNATQHAKIFILRFENSFRLILGSANLTESGLHRNREVYIECDLDEHSGDWTLFGDVLTYLEAMSASMSGGFDSMLRSWRRQAEKLSATAKQDGPSSTRFVGVGPSQGRLSFRKLLTGFFSDFSIEGTRDQRVDEIYVLSPFFEEEPDSNPDHTTSMLYREYYDLKDQQKQYPYCYLYLLTRNKNITTLFPRKSYSKFSEELGDRFFVYENPELRDEEKTEKPRFPHAKLYVVRNASGYMMTVLGSSNFSPSGFGNNRNSKKNNWEANIAFFSKNSETKDLKALFPKAKDIEDEVWQAAADLSEEAAENPDEHDDDLIVLVDASFKEGKLSVRANVDQPSEYRYYIDGSPLDLRWNGLDGRAENSPVSGVSVEVRDRAGKLIQDIPINFLDDSHTPIEMSISRQDLVGWIEARYLEGKHLPLSMLLENLKRKSSNKNARISMGEISTDDYMIYRVKMFNSLVSKIFDRLRESRIYTKRVEYHLIGKFGLVNCVMEYLGQAKALEDREVFYVYQAVELVTSVLGAFEGETQPDTMLVVQQFWDSVSQMLSEFEPKSSGRDQLRDYILGLNKFAQTILGDLKSSEVKSGEVVPNVAV